jgi:hypothetical protein
MPFLSFFRTSYRGNGDGELMRVKEICRAILVPHRGPELFGRNGDLLPGKRKGRLLKEVPMPISRF